MSKLDELKTKKENLELELIKAREDARRRREAQDEWDGTAKIRRQREKEEAERIASLTPEEKVGDEIITLEQMIDMERGVYTHRIRPREKQPIVKW